jgi:hypothetical protein
MAHNLCVKKLELRAFLNFLFMYQKEMLIQNFLFQKIDYTGIQYNHLIRIYI